MTQDDHNHKLWLYLFTKLFFEGNFFMLKYYVFM